MRLITQDRNNQYQTTSAPTGQFYRIPDGAWNNSYYIYERIDYLPFGEIYFDKCYSPFGTYGEADSPFLRSKKKYTGQDYDYLTGLYFYGSRYYDPQVGQFSQADSVVPVPTDGQAFNRYAYCANNPYKYVDPTGHMGVPVFLGICTLVGALIGAIIGWVGAAIRTRGSNRAMWGGALGGAEQGAIIGFNTGAFLASASPKKDDPNEVQGVESKSTKIIFVNNRQTSSQVDSQQNNSTKDIKYTEYKDRDLSEIPKDSNSLHIVLRQEDDQEYQSMCEQVLIWHDKYGTDYLFGPSNMTQASQAIDQAVATHGKYDAVVIHSHGDYGAVSFNQALDKSDFGVWSSDISDTPSTMMGIDKKFPNSISSALSTSGKTYFVTCRTGGEGKGLKFMNNVATTTGHPVIANVGLVKDIEFSNVPLGPMYTRDPWRQVNP